MNHFEEVLFIRHVEFMLCLKIAEIIEFGYSRCDASDKLHLIHRFVVTCIMAW